MIRKIVASAVLTSAAVGAALALGTSSASADPSNYGWIAAGVYPSMDAAVQTCAAGKNDGRWVDCATTGVDGQIQLWVATSYGLPAA
ncbi:MAG: hypothetical protein LBV34_25610 [Nocardiopsaceae bacterium]|jgi:hypothetical protein|nr:hypothetical protein [Nocardiopsaceae bacterium]